MKRMKIQKRTITFFERAIADFFAKAGREHLPWRKKGITAYEVWVSEIMLQQTQVSRVIGYYENFLKRFPTIESLAESSWEEFLPYYAGLGYYARGRNMQKAAKMIVEKYNGVFPKDRKTLESLPGIGAYTAAAILSFAYGDPHLAWDTNLKRVIGRFFFGSKRADFDGNFFEEHFSVPAKILNAALMDFGSGLCVARPKCSACMLREKCAYFKESGAQEKLIGVTKKKRQSEKITETRAVVFLHAGHREYFSSKKNKYQPFFPPKRFGSDRAGIKKYFLETHDLVVSVRPPHRKQVKVGVETLFVNAQILSGGERFRSFRKESFSKWFSENHKGILTEK